MGLTHLPKQGAQGRCKNLGSSKESLTLLDHCLLGFREVKGEGDRWGLQ